MIIFYLVMMLVNALIGTWAVYTKRWHLVYSATISFICSYIWYAEKAYNLIK